MIILIFFLSLIFVIKLLYVLSATLWLPITKGALFVPTSSARVKAALEAVPSKAEEIFVDLGCGYGHVLRCAHKKFGLKVIGFEINPLAFMLARIICLFYPGITIRYRNFWKIDLGQADIVFCYLFPDVMERLSIKLMKECRSGVRVISCNFSLPRWKPVKTIKPKSTGHHSPIYIYYLPESCNQDIVLPKRSFSMNDGQIPGGENHVKTRNKSQIN